MAKRGSNKHRSREQEEHIADVYDGRVSPSSGAAEADAGDVRTKYELIECKTTGGPEKPARSTLVKQMEKITDEAWAEGREPVLCLRFYMPDSPLANSKGLVELSVRLTREDAERNLILAVLSEGQSCSEDGARWRSS